MIVQSVQLVPLKTNGSALPTTDLYMIYFYHHALKGLAFQNHAPMMTKSNAHSSPLLRQLVGVGEGRLVGCVTEGRLLGG